MAEKFTQQVCQQLDQSIDQMDPALKEKLAIARRAALQQSLEKTPQKPSVAQLWRPVFYWPVMAAALLAVVILPNLPTQRSMPVPEYSALTSIYDVEPDLLETMDLLWAVEDLADREMNAL